MADQSPALIPIRKTKRGRAPLAGVLAALLILVAAIVWTLRNGKDDPAADRSRPLRADFETIWGWSDAEYAGGASGAEWSFRWDGTASPKAAKSFAAGLGFYLGDRLAEGTEPIDVVASDPAYKMTLWIHSRPRADGEQAENPAFYDIVLLLDAAKNEQRQTLADAIGKVERHVAESDLKLRGGFTVKGTAAREGARARVAKAASAGEAEAYDDGHTSSLTYYSAALGSKVQSASKAVNLQIAETSAAAGKGSELIIGVPLITGDYTMQDK
ncbi:YwmB family TATA-box binding protein [Paenibacillus glycinis]|uniref:TATA-box binding protein n=1 Tax=Paenibacillus glycinis TaxID=2697035 RepID=A0ABW9XZQ9_9BACL|nr:YwmB family TATA-box binding protein [Paenibacillus glycinis]NBD27716.1 hypothetical protein [Paenibacillus glycinis]